MKVASISEIKTELTQVTSKELIDICLRLARYKKDNKELLTYLLFEANDLTGYIDSVKKVVDEDFAGMNRSNLYLAKKTLRKILRTTNRYIRYTGSKEAEVELLLHYLQALKHSGIEVSKSTALSNIVQSQLKKIRLLIAGFHEDLQYEYHKQLDALAMNANDQRKTKKA